MELLGSGINEQNSALSVQILEQCAYTSIRKQMASEQNDFGNVSGICKDGIDTGRADLFDWRRARATHQFKYAASAIVLQSDESTSFAANRDIPLRWSGRDAHQLAIDIPLLRSGRQEHPLTDCRYNIATGRVSYNTLKIRAIAVQLRLKNLTKIGKITTHETLSRFIQSPT